MSYHLFLDDSRQPQDVKWIELPPLDWIVVTNYNDFIKTVTENGIPTTVSFDHDIYPEHYSEFTVAHDKKTRTSGTICYEKFVEKTGYDCAKWLANFCVDKQVPVPLYYIHTLNGIGAANIFKVMEAARLLITKQ